MRSELTRGASAVEYAILMALIAVVIIVAITIFGESVSELFQRSADSVPT